jgi:hypothetical protein
MYAFLVRSFAVVLNLIEIGASVCVCACVKDYAIYTLLCIDIIDSVLRHRTRTDLSLLKTSPLILFKEIIYLVSELC